MDDCIFCKIAAGKIGSLIFEDEEVAAFRDINPCAPVHILIVPKRHIPGIGDDTRGGAIIARMSEASVAIAKAEGISESGYRIVINSGSDAGQSVAHLHMHLLGGRVMGWPPG